ncbi:MAG TPA: MBL fold metallo-hydrolase [Pseudomonadota bacterium]|nr:MBL fold metallo-hydrolase [Rhodanobacteraceae bacterium]MBP9154327.1 MBL fold metallo-hydrolase [Xanthomonadales bacterium]HQW81329.1 MBL fold metallo-hydrolase [Pseudomonadota bacterium]
MKLTFFGAAGEVTGSCHLVEASGKRILLDCGLIQSGHDEDKRNAARFDFDLNTIDAVILSHAHIDHVGRLPLLRKRGYRGPVYTQRATRDLSKIMLEDSARLAAADIEYENRRRARRGLKALEPLYDEDDVEHVLHQLKAVDYDQTVELFPGLRFRLRDAGHIIGAAIVELWADEDDGTRKLVFSGDIGPKGTPILRDPTTIEDADLVMMESTYGDRLHRARSDTLIELGKIFREVGERGGNILIPAFAVGRTQEILYWCAQHFDDWGLDRFRIALDSPMATKVVKVYDAHQDLFDDEAKRVWRGRVHPFRLPNLQLVANLQESIALNNVSSGLIVIAGSGMCNGGRIRHHLKHQLWRATTHVIFPGYQAAGTLGRQLVDGAKFVKIFGEQIKVNATLHTIGGLSAHADQAGLAEWYGVIKDHPPVWLVHGEDKARMVFADKLRQDFGANVSLAHPGESVVF